MGRPKQDPTRAATPERILDAAEHAFADHGLAAPLADIAARVGIRRPSLLYHFPTKEALYGAVVRRTFLALGALLGGVMAEPGAFEDRLEGLIRAFASFLREHPHYARIVVRELLTDGGPGQDILSNEVAPLLSGVVAWIEAEGAGVVPRDLPLRQAVMHVASGVLLSCGSGLLREALWAASSVEHHVAVVRGLFLPREV